jgi:hypothetical protein
MTQPRPRTVDDYAAPYANILEPIPRQGDGICPVCRTGCPGYARCYRCGVERSLLGSGAADAVGLIALAFNRDEQFGYELLRYKHERVPEGTRRDLSIRLAAVLWKWLAIHRRCLATAAGVDDFPIITSVPTSNRQRHGRHPLVAVVSEIVEGTNDNYRDLLRRSDVAMGDHDYRADRFTIAQRLHGEPILVVDDRWTSGAQLQGASAALKAAGSGPVAVLAMGRHYYPSDERNGAVEEQRRKRRWSWDECLFDG